MRQPIAVAQLAAAAKKVSAATSTAISNRFIMNGTLAGQNFT